MKTGLKKLAKKEYPGRLIILGKEESGKNVVAIYAITGRSPSSQARKLVKEADSIWTKPTDERLLKEAKAELLIYPALYFSGGIAISNGKQTIEIRTKLGQSKNPAEILCSALSDWDYEDDPPLFTPRISGCLISSERAALSIIKRGKDGYSIRNIFEFPLAAGKGRLISTYKGESEKLIAPFSGEPETVELNEKKPEDMAEVIYEALGPRGSGRDLRVAVACVFSSDLESREYDVSIINRLKG